MDLIPRVPCYLGLYYYSLGSSSFTEMSNLAIGDSYFISYNSLEIFPKARCSLDCSIRFTEGDKIGEYEVQCVAMKKSQLSLFASSKAFFHFKNT